MFDYNDITATSTKLFTAKWLCKLNPEYIAMLNEMPDIDDVNIDDGMNYIQAGFPDQYTVTRTVYEPSKEYILAMLTDQPRITLDMQYQPDLNLIGPERAWLSCAQIAEIVYKNGTVNLMEPKDAVEIHTTVGTYIKHVAQRKMYEPHFIAPPEEDMAAFERLFNLLDNLANGYSRSGTGNAALAALFRGNGISALGMLVTQQDQVASLKIDGGQGVAEVLTEFKESRSPYRFTNG